MSDSWRPTHRIALPNRESFEVMLRDGVAYTEPEWKAIVAPDIEVNEMGQWLFQGYAFKGSVAQLPCC